MPAFSPKDSREIELFTYDFSTVLASAEVIASAISTMTVELGADPNPSTMLVGFPVISGQQVIQMIGGGIAGNLYEWTSTITTSASQTFVMCADIQVQTCD